jgi:tRNA(Ile)-lysidine synthase
VLDSIRRDILRYNMLSSGDRLGVAVSGGADSVALLAALRELAPSLGLTLSVVHVNHQLRGAESDADQAFVAHLAHAAGLPLHTRHAPIAAGDNIEQAARQARLAFFAGLIAANHMDKVATAHTEDDQAETVLLRLLRGAGPTGLAGILPVRDPLIRPLLDLPRQSVRDWARERGLTWREDSSNADPAFARNRIRAELLPQLEHDWNPALKPLLAQTARLTRQDNAYLEAVVENEANRLLTAGPHHSQVLDVNELQALAPALQGRLIRKAIERLRGSLARIDFQHIQRILALAEAPEGDGRLQIPGVDVLRSFAWLRFAPWPGQAPETRNWSLPVTLNDEITLPGDACRLRLQTLPRGQAYNVGTDWLDLSHVALEELEIRNWRPGDHFLWKLQDSAERVKLLFQQYRIPLWERRDWPMITWKDEIVWMLGMGVAANRQTGEAAPRSLAIQAVSVRPSAVNMRNRLNLNPSGGRLLS